MWPTLFNVTRRMLLQHHTHQWDEHFFIISLWKLCQNNTDWTHLASGPLLFARWLSIFSTTGIFPLLAASNSSWSLPMAHLLAQILSKIHWLNTQFTLALHYHKFHWSITTILKRLARSPTADIGNWGKRSANASMAYVRVVCVKCICWKMIFERILDSEDCILIL
jgi:hypothetical protein